jgi:hypothetical protein
MSMQKRYELKFVLDNIELNSGLNWLYCQTRCRPRYRPRVVNSLYFDTPDFRSARDNLTGAPKRYKTRLRWYQDESDACSSPVLEVKFRDGRLGGKQHFALSSSDTPVYDLPAQKIPAALYQAVQENPEALRLFDDVLLPVLFVRYLREYYEDADGLRVTLDRQIAFSYVRPFRTLSEIPNRDYPLTIMELKFPPENKDAVSWQLRPFHPRPKRHSKYLTGLAIFGLVNYL